MKVSLQESWKSRMMVVFKGDSRNWVGGTTRAPGNCRQNNEYIRCLKRNRHTQKTDGLSFGERDFGFLKGESCRLSKVSGGRGREKRAAKIGRHSLAESHYYHTIRYNNIATSIWCEINYLDLEFEIRNRLAVLYVVVCYIRLSLRLRRWLPM